MEREGLFELRRTTFDTPEFRGIEFIEAEAKSIINHVPGQYLPFSWTINPYRGCSHACSYCSRGDTPILMADGSVRALAEVRPGDRICGTERRGAYRHYVITTVLDHWSVTKPAYRTTLEDGTELVTSGDHRFLTNRGWKHVTGCEQGSCRRPFLTTNIKLMGTGKFARPPEHDPDYQLGYLAGMIRGDGHLGRYRYPRGTHHRFRLALVDSAALDRTGDYLAALDVPTREFAFSAVAGRKPVRAIRNYSASAFATIEGAIRWPTRPTLAWRKGFLAGIFDAEGGYSRGILRISNTDPTIIAWLCDSLRRFAFGYVVEPTIGRKGLTTIRVRGGVREHLRFFLTVDPAIVRKRSIEGQAIKNDAPLRVVSVEPLGLEVPLYDITTGTGDFIADGVVSHNCFARSTHTFLDMDAGRDFETKIVVKVNAPQVLRAQLGAKRWKGEHIAMGTGTDPYQRAEGRYRLMRGIVEALTDYRNPFSILTKSPLILRDLDLLTEAAKVTDVGAALSVGTLDEDAWRRSEPGTPHPRKRLDAVRALNEAGIPAGVMVAPILPGISDRPEQLRAVVEAAIEAGATHVSPILLHLRPLVKEEYLAWLEREYPDLVPRYLQMYANRAYAKPADRDAVAARVAALVGQAGGLRTLPGTEPRHHRRRFGERGAGPRSDGPDQLSLLG